LGKCKVLENAYEDWWNNYWWILLIIGSLGTLAMIIWRIWDCCEPKFEKTKRKFKKFKDGIRKCCYCSSDNDSFIRDIENNINLDSNDLNLYNKNSAKLVFNEIKERNIKIISSCVSNDRVEVNNINNNIEGNEGGNIIDNNNKSKLIKFIVEKEGNYQYKSAQSDLRDRENNIDPNANCVYFPAGPCRKEASHVFMNIIQPRKPLSFLPPSPSYAS
jgi:hypothetical protein